MGFSEEEGPSMSLTGMDSALSGLSRVDGPSLLVNGLSLPDPALPV